MSGITVYEREAGFRPCLDMREALSAAGRNIGLWGWLPAKTMVRMINDGYGSLRKQRERVRYEHACDSSWPLASECRVCRCTDRAARSQHDIFSLLIFFFYYYYVFNCKTIDKKSRGSLGRGRVG